MVFELYNEPHGALDNCNWNGLHPQFLAAVRAFDGERTVPIGSENWSNTDALARLQMPADRNVIATAHAYDPHRFTHQQIPWGGNYPASSCCDDAQRAVVVRSMQRAKAWSLQHGRPMYIGEFGTYIATDAPSRVNFARLVRTTAEAQGFSWAVWNFGSDFGIYDTGIDAWNQPLLDALMRD